MGSGTKSGHVQQDSCFIPVVRPARSMSFGDNGRNDCFRPRVTTCVMTRGDSNDKESIGADWRTTMEGIVREFRKIEHSEQRHHDSQLVVGSPLYESLYFKVGRRARAGAVDQQAALYGNGERRRGALMLRRLREIDNERKREQRERQRAKVFEQVGHLLLSPLSLLDLMH